MVEAAPRIEMAEEPTGDTRWASKVGPVMIGVAIVAATQCDRVVRIVRQATSDGGMCLD